MVAVLEANRANIEDGSWEGSYADLLIALTRPLGTQGQTPHPDPAAIGPSHRAAGPGRSC